MSADPHHLDRFVRAQDEGGTFARAVAELRAGRKQSHWMWFVFPQLTGLGRSPTAQHFAISGLAEAEAYLVHPQLGARLRSCAEILIGLPGQPTADGILGAVDALKLRSSMTLFQRAAAGDPGAPFTAVLERYFEGRADPATELALQTAG